MASMDLGTGAEGDNGDGQGFYLFGATNHVEKGLINFMVFSTPQRSDTEGWPPTTAQAVPEGRAAASRGGKNSPGPHRADVVIPEWATHKNAPR